MYYVCIHLYQYTVSYCCSWPCPASGAKATGSSWGVSCLQYSTVSYPTHRAHGSCKTWTGLKGDVYIHVPVVWWHHHVGAIPHPTIRMNSKAVLMVELQALTFISTLFGRRICTRSDSERWLKHLFPKFHPFHQFHLVHRRRWAAWIGGVNIAGFSRLGSESLFGPCLSISCCSGSGIGGRQSWDHLDVSGVAWLHSENGCSDETSQKLWREVLYALYFSPGFFLSVSLILASCVAFILMMLLKPSRLIQATPQQNRRAPVDFRGCTKTSSSNAAGRFLLRFTRLTSHLIEELGTTELLEDEGIRVHWDGDFRWFKVSEDVQQPQLLVVLWEVSKRFILFPWWIFAYWVLISAESQFPCNECPVLSESRMHLGQIYHLSGAEDLDGELCNASPLGTCLRGCGRYWCLKADINVEDVTVPSHYYDAFVSHEWGSSGLLKVLTLAPWLRFVGHQAWGMKTDGSDGLLGTNGFRWIDCQIVGGQFLKKPWFSRLVENRWESFLNPILCCAKALKSFLTNTETMTYNLGAATVATLLGSLLLGVLRVFELLPDDERTVAIGYAIFFVFICFWQRIRESQRTSLIPS